MINKVAEFLSLCPYLHGKEINVNYLDHKDGAVMLKVEGEQRVIRKYADGGALKSVVFGLVIRRGFAPEIARNKCLADEFGKIEMWIEEQNLKGNLPEIKNALRAVSVGVEKCFKVSDTDRSGARYEAKIELIYIS